MGKDTRVQETFGCMKNASCWNCHPCKTTDCPYLWSGLDPEQFRVVAVLRGGFDIRFNRSAVVQYDQNKDIAGGPRWVVERYGGGHRFATLWEAIGYMIGRGWIGPDGAHKLLCSLARVVGVELLADDLRGLLDAAGPERAAVLLERAREIISAGR